MPFCSHHCSTLLLNYAAGTIQMAMGMVSSGVLWRWQNCLGTELPSAFDLFSRTSQWSATTGFEQQVISFVLNDSRTRTPQLGRHRESDKKYLTGSNFCAALQHTPASHAAEQWGSCDDHRSGRITFWCKSLHSRMHHSTVFDCGIRRWH